MGGQRSCTSSGCNQQQRNPVHPLTDEGQRESSRRTSSQMRGFPSLRFPLDAPILKPRSHPLFLELTQVHFQPFFLFCSAPKKLSFHEHGPLEKVVLHQLGCSFVRQLLRLCLMGLANFPTSCLPFDSLFIQRENTLI